jgi:integrase
VPTRRFHRTRNVRLHASGNWVVTIGRTLSPKTKSLVDKDWYFAGSQAEATDKANAKARQWELLCANWDRTERPYLDLLKRPMPTEPRWPDKSSSQAVAQIDGESLNEIRREGPLEFEELAQAYAEFTFAELIPVYDGDRRNDLKQKDVQNSTVSKDLSQMRQAARYLPQDISGVRLTAEHFRSAKQKMFDAKLSRRTVRNYLSAAVKLLRWVYSRYGGNDARVPPGIEDAITIRAAIKTKIFVYGVEELKRVVTALKGTISQMDCLIALNCGMYQEDIGRLRLDEFDPVEGSFYWDREKEPANDFRLHHVLWPETLRLVRHYLNKGNAAGKFDDYRHSKKDPEKVDVRDLAFLDKDRPRYSMKPSGSSYDLVGRRWANAGTGVQFRNLRKSSNEILTNLITHDGGNDALLVVDEISNRFLGQKSATLVRLYRTNGKAVYRRMNRALVLVGDHLRANGVFDSIMA